MARISLPQASKFKLALLFFGFLIVAAVLWYTHTIVRLLQDREKQIADLYAHSLEYLASARDVEGDYSFVFDEIIRKSYFIDFPIILTDPSNEPIRPLRNAYKNITIDSTLDEEGQRNQLKELVRLLDEQNPPILVAYRDTVLLNYVHYGESPLVTQLRWLPYIEISIAAIFILIGYISFSYVKKTEQNNIWVGMARETAHQLGTPISGIMGWIEMLKLQSGGNERLAETVNDLETDLQRLQKIAERFSKIGSRPDLKEHDLVDLVKRVHSYFGRRIPNTGKKVRLILTNTAPVSARINAELFEWVIENLTKNALDAIETPDGTITVSISEHPKFITIDVTDTGKGIDAAHRKEVFRPGFSTKRRGWGLGLSLSKRIVETYHSGKLMLRESQAGIGTTFRIRLNR